MGKYVELESLRNKKLEAPVVLTGGFFDLFHLGHLEFLKRCKEFGKTLIVSVMNDEITKQVKGPLRPIIEGSSRVKIVSHLEFVDFAFLSIYRGGDKRMLDIIRPDILIFTKENREEKINRLIKDLGVKKFKALNIKFIPRSNYQRSTTKIIESIIERHKQT